MSADFPHRLGFKQKPDPRDENYPLSRFMALTRPGKTVSKFWRPGPVLDQRNTSSCVGRACWQVLAGEPVLSPLAESLTAMGIYDEARKNDEWPDNDNVDEGTSVRAGLEVLKRHGAISAYFWGKNAAEAGEFLLHFGGLVFGINWTQDMFQPDNNGIIHPTGALAGGHAIYACGCDWRGKFIMFQNSWGRGWGQDGGFKISFADLDRLINDGGVFAAVQEVPA